MSDGFKFNPERVTAAAQAFRSRHGTPKQLAGPLDRTGPSVQTGETSLDEATRDVVKQITTMLGRYSECLEREAFALEWTVAAYRTSEEASREEIEELADNPALRGSRPPVVTGAAPVGAPNYDSALNPG
ncbi:MAG TPA: hypothetical protein VFC19_13255 [Candidatus Limnocylindrales bacterium]|nr:hypothetical protein [Candidatus Limnocylindrales bacterium]